MALTPQSRDGTVILRRSLGEAGAHHQYFPPRRNRSPRAQGNVLLCLAQHSGETLSKERLFQAVWFNITLTGMIYLKLRPAGSWSVTSAWR
jgi:hypothetical protein